MVEVLTLHLLLVGFPVVEVVEVGHDDGDGQGDREHTRDRAERAHDLAPHTHRPGGEKGDKLDAGISERPHKGRSLPVPPYQLISEWPSRLGQTLWETGYFGVPPGYLIP